LFSFNPLLRAYGFTKQEFRFYTIKMLVMIGLLYAINISNTHQKPSKSGIYIKTPTVINETKREIPKVLSLIGMVLLVLAFLFFLL